MTKFVWIPEAPGHSGLYANLTDRGEGKLVLEQPAATFSVYDARQFATEGECQAWCDENPVPIFVPREHGFYGSTAED